MTLLLPLELTTVSYLDRVVGLVHPVCWSALNLLDHIHAFHNLTKHHMLSIKVSTGYCADEELAAVCAGSCKHLEGSTPDNTCVARPSITLYPVNDVIMMA